MTVTDRLRDGFDGLTRRAGQFIIQMGVHPDTITIAGLLLVAVAAVYIGRGDLTIGGVLLIISLPLDALDGAAARAMERTDQFGAVLDSTLDRIADGLIFGALAMYFASLDQFTPLLLSLAALVGSYGISYVRARAGEAGLTVKIGLFSRLERVIALLVMLLIPPLLLPLLWVLAIGTNFTVLQRLWYVYRHLDSD